MNMPKYYYTIVESEQHFDNIMRYMNDNMLFFNTPHSIMFRSYGKNLVIYYPKNIKNKNCVLSYGSLENATTNLSIKRKDLFVDILPNDLFKI